jgi:hypothetical protein
LRQARRLVALVALGALVPALSGCENNAERSASLERQAKRHVLTHQSGLQVTRLNPNVKVIATALLHEASGTAAVVTLRNESSRPLRDAPIAITVSGSGGTVLYRNNAAGLDASLVSVPLLLPHREFSWIDDQVQSNGTPTALSARVGEAASPAGQLPRLEIQGAHTSQEASNGAGAEGTVVNRSRVTQQALVVYAVARRGGRIVAAGRAVLPEAAAGASTPFQVFFIGNPQGATLEVIAPPTTLG